MKYGTGIGEIAWVDLTVPNATELAGFYEEVIGWKRAEHDMGDYADYVMSSSESGAVGVCHARGSNAAIPPHWMVYINVESVSTSAAKCVELGGEIIDGPRKMGEQHFCLLKDPAGAYLGLLSALE